MCETNYSQPITDAIINFLKESGIIFSFDRKNGKITYMYTLEGKIKKVNLQIEVHDNDYVVYAYSGVGVDFGNKGMMAAMAEFICRANFGIQPGNFELDMDTGAIRYKYYMNCDGIIPSLKAIEKSVMYPVVMIDDFSLGILDILFKNAMPEEAVRNCKKAFLQMDCEIPKNKNHKNNENLTKGSRLPGAIQRI